MENLLKKFYKLIQKVRIRKKESEKIKKLSNVVSTCNKVNTLLGIKVLLFWG